MHDSTMHSPCRFAALDTNDQIANQGKKRLFANAA